MLLVMIFITLLTSGPSGTDIIVACVPNTYFLLNDQLCYCNSLGQLNKTTCHMINVRQLCYPGQIILKNCKQCICQDNGNLLCTNTECTDKRNHSRPSPRSDSKIWCNPFHSYYFNCTLCICPASGKLSEARCITDSSCTLKGLHISPETILQSICIPKVMYLFTCIHCLCSDDGVFQRNKCIDTCLTSSTSTKRCKPKSFYKKDCNICFCPETGTSDGKVCSNSTCSEHPRLMTLNSLRNKALSCTPHKFTKPRCIYCECRAGFVNEEACFEQACLRIGNYNYESIKNSCSPEEMVLICMECFCPYKKLTTVNYCTKNCSYRNKLAILETILKENTQMIDRNIIKSASATRICEPDSLFLDQGRYCLCPINGSATSEYCTSVLENNTFIFKSLQPSLKIYSNITCEPHTFVQFDCNSCYCTKSGTIDRKWCTYDNCEIENKNYRKDSTKMLNDTTCSPGSILKINCNFCICGSSGRLADIICTNNSCNHYLQNTDREFECEPSSYYIVDCNICICPSDGIKNVNKCTKNRCNTFFRPGICSPGKLFSENCNICICPPNGLKKNKICTKKTCSKNDIALDKIFKISLSLSGSYANYSQNERLCLPGEQFEIGCKLCMCPDIGLRSHALCTNEICDNQTTPITAINEEDEDEETDHFKEDRKSNKQLPIGKSSGRRILDTLPENCMDYNITESDERKKCTPGSEYIVRCRICICPYMGYINHFCRPMPANRYCEQAYPGFNFLPMGRRNEVNSTNTTTTVLKREFPIRIHAPHNHTEYKCNDMGRIQDYCYICECKNNIIIQEHCFKNDAENCTEVSIPSFLRIENKL